jgi:hypothetical protein
MTERTAKKRKASAFALMVGFVTALVVMSSAPPVSAATCSNGNGQTSSGDTCACGQNWFGSDCKASDYPKKAAASFVLD